MTGILQGKSLIVTGAGGGIGRAASIVLAAAGAKVVVSDIVEAAGQATVDAVQKGGGTALFVKADLATESDVRALVQRSVSAYGRLDGAFSAFFDKLKGRHPIGRLGEPSEIGEAVKWLLSDAASFMNGAAMACDGGYLSI